MNKILFYVSGHGYGHAVRMAEVINALHIADPSATVTVRTTAPESLFRGNLPESVRVVRACIDPDVVEKGIFRIDWGACREKLSMFLSQRAAIIESETAWANRNKIRLIVADIPFLAGEIAQAAQIPCIGISNFLWDWIYEPMLKDDSRGADLIRMVRGAYQNFHSVLRLPFSHPMNYIDQVVDVPLVANVSKRSRSEILSAIGVDNQRIRPLILMCFREPVYAEALNEVASLVPDCLFLQVGRVPANCASNLISVSIGHQLTFADIISVADLVVAKPGYGLMAACAASRKRLLYVPRVGFREDEVLLQTAANLIPIAVLPLPEFEEGTWGVRLRDILSKPVPNVEVDLSGAQVCAEYIAKQ